MADRHKRIKALVARNVADIVQFEIKKPSIGLVSVNDVEVYDDMSQATHAAPTINLWSSSAPKASSALP